MITLVSARRPRIPWWWGASAVCVLMTTAMGSMLAVEQPLVDPRLTQVIGWYTGTTGQVDDARAKLLLEAAARDGDVLARMWVARCQSRGRMGYARNEAQARAIAAMLIDAVRRQASQGVVEAVFLMGSAFDEGLGVEEDPAQAAEWFRKAAAAGHTLAEHNLGNAYAAGRGLAQDPTEAAAWWRKAAVKGDAVTQLRLGEAYEHGRGVTADAAEARRWYGEAATRGNAAAKAALARLGAG